MLESHHESASSTHLHPQGSAMMPLQGYECEGTTWSCAILEGRVTVRGRACMCAYVRVRMRVLSI